MSVSETKSAIKTPSISIYRIFTVIAGGILVHLTLGSFYTFGNFSPYIVSYLKNRTDHQTIRNVDSIWIANAGAFFNPFAMSFGGFLDRRLGTRIAMTIGCAIFCIGVALTYWTIRVSLVLVAVSYGALVQIGSGITYGPPVQMAVKCVPSKPTLVVGLIVCGFGGGALVFNQVITAFINPDNLSPDLKVGDERVPTVFLLLTAIYISCQVIGIIGVGFAPSDKKYRQLPIQLDTILFDELPDIVSSVSLALVICISAGKDINLPHNSRCIVLKTKNAYILLLIIFLIIGGMQFALSLYKAYGQTFINDDHFLALVGSMASIFNCIFRPIWGSIMDKFGFQIAVKTMCACFVCLSCTLLLTEELGKAAFMIWICGLYASFCGVFSIGPSTLSKLFGVSNLAVNMGFMFGAVGAATIAGGFLGLTLQGVVGWHGLFLLSGCLGVIAPVGGVLNNRYSCRVFVVGGVLITLGFSTSVFVPSLNLMIVNNEIIVGTGYGISSAGIAWYSIAGKSFVFDSNCIPTIKERTPISTVNVRHILSNTFLSPLCGIMET